MALEDDTGLRSSLMRLAVAMVIVGICMQSWKKIMVTYVVSILGIAGLLLPHWDFFDRDFSWWSCPVTAEERAPILAQRYGIYPIRLVAYTTIYGFALYNWWKFISN